MSNWDTMRTNLLATHIKRAAEKLDALLTDIGPSYAMHALTGELRAIRREIESIEVLAEDKP